MKVLVKELGFLNAVLYVAHSILSRLSRGRIRLVKYYTYCQPLLQQHTGRGKAIDTFIANSDHDNIFAAPRAHGVITARLNEGSQCLMAEKRGEFLGFLWLKPDEYQEDEVRCHYLLKPTGCYAWDYDVYIVPKARLGYAFFRLWETASSHLVAQNYKATISRIDAFNVHSIRSHERLGAKRVGTLLFICIGPCQLMLGTHAPYIHLSCSVLSVPATKIYVNPDQFTS